MSRHRGRCSARTALSLAASRRTRAATCSLGARAAPGRRRARRPDQPVHGDRGPDTRAAVERPRAGSESAAVAAAGELLGRPVLLDDIERLGCPRAEVLHQRTDHELAALPRSPRGRCTRGRHPPRGGRRPRRARWSRSGPTGRCSPDCRSGARRARQSPGRSGSLVTRPSRMSREGVNPGPDAAQPPPGGIRGKSWRGLRERAGQGR
jgi:hypothetical protein